MKTIKLNISGKVQGVGYRRWFAKHAKFLSLNGYVKNLENGSVEALIQGSEQNVETMITRSLQGPPCAEVESIQRETVWTLQQQDVFEVLR